MCCSTISPLSATRTFFSMSFASEQSWQFDRVASVSFAKHSEQPQTWQRYAGVTQGWMDECVVHAFASLPSQWVKARMTEL